MTHEHSFVKTGRAFYTCPLSVEYRCESCGFIECRDEGEGIRVLKGLEAIRIRPGMYGLTQDEADKLTCARAHEQWPQVQGSVECNDGWVHIQHPLKPLGVTMQTIPCGVCNADQRFPFPQPSWSFSTVETKDGESQLIITISYPES